MLDARHLFVDQSHIDQVRDALWGDYGNGASVMVGSGFSKFARSAVLLIDRSARLMLRSIIPPMAHQPCFSDGLLGR